MTAEDAQDEIWYYLNKLNKSESNDLDNQPQVTFWTSHKYLFCHTSVDAMNLGAPPQLVASGFGYLHVTMAWTNNQYYKIMHIDDYDATT
jgi:hypothetical protein